MKILSIHYGHNATVGLSINGEIRCILGEERIGRVKNATGFPTLALKHVIDTYLDGDANQCDALVINDELLLGFRYLEIHGFEAKPYAHTYYYLSRKGDIDKLAKSNIRRLLGLQKKRKEPALFDGHTRNQAMQKIASLTGISSNKIIFLNHHLAHGYASGFFPLPKHSRWIVFTLDGVGDNISGSVGLLENGSLKVLSTVKPEASLGYLYGAVTAYLGMKPDEHEFKVMGLAPYAYEEHAERIARYFHDILRLNNHTEFESSLNLGSFELREYLIRHLLYERFDNIAGGLQLFIERIICEWINGWIKKTGINSIILGGGVFMNVKAAKKVSELDTVGDIFVIPSAGDESLVIGGCYYGNMLHKTAIKPIETLYLGRECTDSEIETFFSENKINNRYHIEYLDQDQMAERVADLLARNKVVARCAGREEWGARALGNRSIMANPQDFETINIINQQIKSRDFWMPFTPSILAESFNDYIINPKNIYAPYMCITFDSTQRAQRELRAAIHPKDKTVRPQLVEADKNPGYYKIIKAFQQRTGIGAILNTSFNLHGEPNVGGARDAIHTLDNSGLQYLVLGNYLVTKKI